MKDMKVAMAITPDAKIGPLLDNFPQLEAVLIDLSPSFAKLRNPILRKTIAKIATLRQVAQIGNIPLGALINTIRTAAGKTEAMFTVGESAEASGKPEWVNLSKIVKSLDARPILDKGEHPLGHVMKDLKELKADEIYELITPFFPAPLIDAAIGKGYQAWTISEGELVKTYFRSA